MQKFITAVLSFMTFSCLSDAQEVVPVAGNGSQSEILVLPFNPYSRGADVSLKEEGKIKVSRDGADFKKQLDKIAAKAASMGGNIFEVTDIDDPKQNNHLDIAGVVYHANDYAAVKTKALAGRQRRYEENTYSFITIYRPTYANGFNDEHGFSIIVNDTLIIPMRAETRCVLKIAGEKNVRVAVKDESVVQHVSAKPGHDYYIRALVNYPGSHRTVNLGEAQVPLRGFAPYVETVSEPQGSLESSLVNKVIINKKI
jgi:hypothetical protein